MKFIHKAKVDSEILVEALRAAYSHSKDLEGIILFDLIKQAAEVKIKLTALVRAMEEKK